MHDHNLGNTALKAEGPGSPGPVRTVTADKHIMEQESEGVDNDFASIQDIYMKENQLQNLPEDIDKGLTGLVSLNLDGNCLQLLPLGLFKLKNLTTLTLNRNSIRDIPEEIGQLSGSLEVLDLSNNQIEVLPNSIGHLGLLEYLILSGNHISHLPSTIGGLKSLKSLHLAHNRLMNLPQELATSCPELTHIYAEHNWIKYIPDIFTKASKSNGKGLLLISLSWNLLQALPLAPFFSCPTILVDNNPSITHVPYIFGCQQNFKALTRFKYISHGYKDGNIKADNGDSWIFNLEGCFLDKRPSDVPQLRTVELPADLLGLPAGILKLPQNIVNLTFAPFRTGPAPSLLERDSKPQLMSPFSLLELSLRKSYDLLFKKEISVEENWAFLRGPREVTKAGQDLLSGDEKASSLPEWIEEELLNGPTAFCCLHSCTGPIFTSACISLRFSDQMRPVVIQPGDNLDDEAEEALDPNHEAVTLFVFCDDICASEFFDNISV